MTPAEAREIDRREFEAECAAIRQRAYALVRPPARAEAEPAHPQAKLYTHNGRTPTLKEWAASLGMSPGTFRRRLKQGWSFDRALSAPLHTRTSKVLQ